MGVPFDRRTLLVRGAAAAGGIAAASVLGLDLAGAAGATTAATGLNGVSKAKPKKGGSLVFGVDAEESGFNPTTARFDEVGVMYARTVFDPLTIIDTKGAWQPYLAQSVTPNADHTAWTITVSANVVFHDGTACDGAALLTNFEAQKASLLLGTLILVPIVDSMTQSARPGDLTFKSPWVSFPFYLAGGVGGQSAYMCAPSMLSAPNGGTSNRSAPGRSCSRSGCPTATSRPRPTPTIGGPGSPTSTRSPSSRSSTRRPGRRPSSRGPSTSWSPTPPDHHPVPWQQEYAYVDDSTHFVGEPDMNCVLLNLAAEPFNTPGSAGPLPWRSTGPSTPRRSTSNVLPVSEGLFTPGSPYYSKTAYPAYNPTEAKKLVKQVAKAPGSR